MLPSIVGPPVKGVADLASSERAKADSMKDPKKAGSDSFGQMLGAKEKGEAQPSKPEASPPRMTQQKPEIKRGESDRKAEKLKATNDEGSEKKTGESSQRQNAILKFMDSFESEFGVPPTRIVEAMANLDPAQQAESPEETADQVVDQLNLDDQDVDPAKNMYMGLLAQLAQIQQQPALLPKPEMVATGAMAGTEARFASSQEKMHALNQSLDNMNEKFWMKGASAPQGIGASQGNLADKMAQISLQEKLGQPQGLASLNVDESSFAREMKAQLPAQNEALKDIQLDSADQSSKSPDAALAALVAAARAAKNRTDAGEIAEDTSGPSFDAGEESAVAVSDRPPGAAGAHAKNIDALSQQGQGQPQQQGFESSKHQHEGFNGQSGTTNAKGEMLEKSKLSEKADFKKLLGSEDSIQPQGLPPVKQDFAVNATAGAGAGAAIAAKPGENEANVRQLMNQAQYLIKKGGGEMKVQMSPEGMGQIHLKVLVENGKVNVQMATETTEAKKALESSLSDLKNSLAAHKLSMDHVKIDVVTGANTENSTQNQTNQDQGGREQNRQFWNKFSENFGSPSQQRESFADIPSMRGYPRKRTDSPLEPIGSSSVSSNYAAAGKGRGLNLVA